MMKHTESNPSPTNPQLVIGFLCVNHVSRKAQWVLEYGDKDRMLGAQRTCSEGRSTVLAKATQQDCLHRKAAIRLETPRV